MALYLGNTKIKELYLGSTKIKEAYLGSTLVYRASPYSPDQIVFEQATAGTYTLDILETGRYEVTVVAGGGGAKTTGGTLYNGTNGSGASGACFKGEIEIAQGSYSIVVGAKGIKSTANGIGNMRGGVSSIGDLVSCPSQRDDGHNSIHYAYRNNGSPTVTATIYSTTINSAGKNGSVNYDGFKCDGGKSALDNTATGYGAGGSVGAKTYIVSVPTVFEDGVDGYVKIVYKGV